MSQTNRNGFIAKFPDEQKKKHVKRDKVHASKNSVVAFFSIQLFKRITIQLEVDLCCYFAQPFCGNFRN